MERTGIVLPYSTIHFTACESTHLWALENLSLLVKQYEFSPTRPVRISADLQTRGIGQRLPISPQDIPSHLANIDENTSYKSWVSSPGNVSVTFVHPWPCKKAHQVVNLPQVASIAIVDTLRVYGLEAQIKWVNDVLINGKKISGILCSSTSYQIPSDNLITDETFTAVLISIGMNVLSTPTLKHLKESEQQPATCIADELKVRKDSKRRQNYNMNSCLTTDTSPIHKSERISSSLPAWSNFFRAEKSFSSLTPTEVLNLLSHHLYQILGFYEAREFSAISSSITPILLGRNQIVTIKHPSVVSTPSAEKYLAVPSGCRLQRDSSIFTRTRTNLILPHESLAFEVDEIRGELLGLSPKSGYLILKVLNTDDVVEICNGHLIPP